MAMGTNQLLQSLNAYCLGEKPQIYLGKGVEDGWTVFHCLAKVFSFPRLTAGGQPFVAWP